MASMNNEERARHYFQRLKKAHDQIAEARKIIDEINGLVWSKTQEKLTKQEKLDLIREIEKIISHGEAREDKFLLESSDNSNILEVIKALKRGVK